MKPAALVCATAAMLAACSAGPAKPLVELLPDATYSGILEQPVTLDGGRFEGEPFTPGSATRPVVTLVPDTTARGDLDGDGSDEAVVVLAYNSGGSGVFMYLAVVRDERGRPDNLVTIGLGDRVRVHAVAIDNGRIIADLVEHAPDDPMCCPTRERRREWSLQDGELVLMAPENVLPDDRIRGHLVWGHENRSFTTCDGEREGWVINGAGDELVSVYEELTHAPYQPMFVEVRGRWVAAPDEGFGAGFEEALRITELLRAENEGFGCRLDLTGLLFVASGNEPFWRLQIRTDGISMHSMDAPDEVVFAAPAKEGQAPRISFRSNAPDTGIRIALEKRRCVDTMSGARFAWVATVDIDERQLTGCAAEGL